MKRHCLFPPYLRGVKGLIRRISQNSLAQQEVWGWRVTPTEAERGEKTILPGGEYLLRACGREGGQPKVRIALSKGSRREPSWEGVGSTYLDQPGGGKELSRERSWNGRRAYQNGGKVVLCAAFKAAEQYTAATREGT